ncbi:MAG: hypothetical protein LBJ25_02875, partial [Candidatus Margulisbacteria bacterium]|nr:hypothetical protein [Candidatus Margulisiibacteriota bacterium]
KQDKLTDAQLALLASLKTLAFFPKGTILPFSSAAWDEASSEFKTIWKICDGSDGRTINLAGKFLRGGRYAEYGQTGGTDTTEVPYHNHGVTDNGHGHPVPFTMSNAYSGDNYEETPIGRGRRGEWSGNWGRTVTIYAENAKTDISVDYAGSQTADNRPAFCTVIFIEKIQ